MWVHNGGMYSYEVWTMFSVQCMYFGRMKADGDCRQRSERAPVEGAA